MKKIIENIKENKLRSALIGCCAFLFGFISVSIFNSVGDTYAFTDDDCPTGWYYDTDSFYTDKGACCPKNYEYSSDPESCSLPSSIGDDYETCPYGERGEYKTCWIAPIAPTTSTIEYQCYHCYATGKSVWGTDKPEESCASTWTIKNNISKTDCVGGACYYCDATGKSVWYASTDKPEESCASTWRTKTGLTEAECAGETYKCYQCNSPTSIYSWSAGTPTSSSCQAGWHTIDRTQATCADITYKCYQCNSPSNIYSWSLGTPTSSSCQAGWRTIDRPQSACTASSNTVTLAATFVANNGTLNGNSTVTCTADSSGSCNVKAPGATREGYNLKGWSKDQNCSSYVGEDSMGYVTLTHERQGNLYACWNVNAPTSGNYNEPEIDDSNDNIVTPPEGGGTTDELPEDVNAYTKSYYKIKYNPNGGTFIDENNNNRITIIPGDKIIGDPKTNPIKEGYKFKEWQLNGTKFNFNQKPTADITLTAVYEKLTEDDKLYYCTEGKLEPTSKLCYKVLKPDFENTYNYTEYFYNSGTRFCYGNSTNKTGGIYFINPNASASITNGKNNQPYDGYNESESWVSNDTCKVATVCSSDDEENVTSACEIRWDAIIFSSTVAKKQEEIFVENEEKPDTPSDGDEGTGEEKPDTPSDGDEGTDEEKPDDKPSNDKTDEDLTDEDAGKLQTGDALIILAWIVGLGALGYTAYYFIKRKREN